MRPFLNAIYVSFVVIAFLSSNLWADEQPVTIDAKIGQMLMTGFRGYRLADAPELERALADGVVGGVILFDYDVERQKKERNIRSPQQLRTLTRELQAASSVPLFIAVDQEGGRVARLNETNGFIRGESHAGFGSMADEKRVASGMSRLAEQLVDSGINLNLAPCVDLCNNPDNPIIARLERCFGRNPAQVATLAARFIDAHHDRQVITALKHFPGHGSSRGDSHLGFVDVSDTWEAAELVPYRQLISRHKADMIMVAHVFNKNFDPEYPASLSERTISELLRKELGFAGIVISDDLQMNALRKYYSDEEILMRAVNAGNDILVLGNNLAYQPDIIRVTIARVKRLIVDGKIPRERIEGSYRRIMELKGRLARQKKGSKKAEGGAFLEPDSKEP